jgi:hypothetical protein
MKKSDLFSVVSVNPLKLNGHYLYYPLYHNKTLHCAHTVHLCVLYCSHNKQQLFH